MLNPVLDQLVETGKGYCSLAVDANSALTIYEGLNKYLDKLSQDIEIIEPHALHCTLIYDKRDEKDIPVPSKPEQLYYCGKVTDVEGLGNAVVLTIKCEDLHKRFNKLIEEGFQHSFPNYKCHVSLAYNPTKEDIDIIKHLFEDEILEQNIGLCNEHWESVD